MYIIWEVKNVNIHNKYFIITGIIKVLFKQVTICLVSLMRVFCPEIHCLEGIMYGGGFVQGGFVRKWLMSTGSYVWRGFCPRGFCLRWFCPRGFCPEGVLSAHRMEGVLFEIFFGGVFVRAPERRGTERGDYRSHSRYFRSCSL